VRAGAPALLVPAGLLAALVAVATVGGGLRGLPQIVQGPEVPMTRGTTPGGPAHAARAARIPAIPGARAPSPRASLAGPRPGTPRGGADAPTATTGPVAPRPSRPSPAPAAPTPGPASPPSPAGSGNPSPSPSPAPTPAPSPPPQPADAVRQVGEAVAGTAELVPLVGPTVAGAVREVVEVVTAPRAARLTATLAP
jgi:hypothetical protein